MCLWLTPRTNNLFCAAAWNLLSCPRWLCMFGIRLHWQTCSSLTLPIGLRWRLSNRFAQKQTLNNRVRCAFLRRRSSTKYLLDISKQIFFLHKNKPKGSQSKQSQESKQPSLAVRACCGSPLRHATISSDRDRQAENKGSQQTLNISTGQLFVEF